MKNLVFLFLVFQLLASCSTGQTDAALDAASFSKQLENTPDAVLLDVRTPGEFAGGHIAGARNLDWNAGAFLQQASDIDHAAPVFVYCLSGGRSGAAATELRKTGFTHVYELQGGMLSWRKSGLPEVIGSAAAPDESGMSESAFADLIKSGNVLIDFYAPWCVPCKKMEPMLKELSAVYDPTVKIVRIDVDKNPQLAKTLGVSGIPLFRLYQNGTMTWEHTGLIERAPLEEQLKKCSLR